MYAPRIYHLTLRITGSPAALIPGGPGRERVRDLRRAEHLRRQERRRQTYFSRTTALK